MNGIRKGAWPQSRYHLTPGNTRTHTHTYRCHMRMAGCDRLLIRCIMRRWWLTVIPSIPSDESCNPKFSSSVSVCACESASRRIIVATPLMWWITFVGYLDERSLNPYSFLFIRRRVSVPLSVWCVSSLLMPLAAKRVAVSSCALNVFMSDHLCRVSLRYFFLYATTDVFHLRILYILRMDAYTHIADTACGIFLVHICLARIIPSITIKRCVSFW